MGVGGCCPYFIPRSGPQGHTNSAANTEPALQLYRDCFRPSQRLSEPYALIGVAVICADTASRARYLHGSSKLSMLRWRTGRPGQLPSPDEAAAYTYTPSDRLTVNSFTGSHVVGDPDGVARQLDELLDRTAADELMITTNVWDHAARLHSFELVAEVAGLTGTGPTGAVPDRAAVSPAQPG
jgi:alkanesulfonate monooxygenase SsuD/methylene tetrahydromethanopterin reductase-like flavin-dependent oxidoreductase (luciferase family)